MMLPLVWRPTRPPRLAPKSTENPPEATIGWLPVDGEQRHIRARERTGVERHHVVLAGDTGDVDLTAVGVDGRKPVEGGLNVRRRLVEDDRSDGADALEGDRERAACRIDDDRLNL